ncbi:hypothetical protein CSW12_05260 [Bacillus cereus]|uniref:acyltransferase n=1 Tax=Bacillus cereus TaxID=1396 RepID=UPI000C2D2C03|nr:acyltransferase family protein [Bacillus cereus]AUB62480.1 hypothetical protein CSW12_05260 [Bacillus cereus]
MDKSKTRYSNFELLKVVSISMVLLLHYFNERMGGGLKHVPNGTFNYYAMYYLESISIIAVNCFILISGYFMINKKQVQLRKAINLLTITVFYGLLLYFVNAVFQIYSGNPWFSLKDLISAAIPLHGSKWFVSSYVILFLLSPFINIVLVQLSKKQFTQLLIIIITSFSIIPTFLPIVSFNDRGYGVLSFIMFYIIGAYLKLHQTKTISRWKYVVVYLISAAFTCILALKFGVNSFGWNYNTIFNVISTICLFQIFSSFKFNSKTINYLATFTFPIYIIHTDAALREVIFRKILRTQEFWDSKWFLLHLCSSILFLFVACVVIEIIRRKIVGLNSKILKIDAIDKIMIGQKNSTESVKQSNTVINS